MYSPTTKNRIIAPICLGIALLVGAIMFRPAYTTYIESTSILSSLEREGESLKAELTTLTEIKNNSSADISPETKLRREKLAKKFDTSDVMSVVLFNDFTKKVGDVEPTISVASISVAKGGKLPNGLSSGMVNISFKGSTISDIIKYITYLTKESPYIFTLDGISLPIDTDPQSDTVTDYSMGISLGMYYFE